MCSGSTYKMIKSRSCLDLDMLYSISASLPTLLTILSYFPLTVMNWLFFYQTITLEASTVTVAAAAVIPTVSSASLLFMFFPLLES